MVEKCNQLVECDNDAELRRFTADRMIKFQDFANPYSAFCTDLMVRLKARTFHAIRRDKIA
jgi:hypothetical protein